MGGTFKWEIYKNVKKKKLGGYVGRYARRKKLSHITPLSPTSQSQYVSRNACPSYPLPVSVPFFCIPFLFSTFPTSRNFIPVRADDVMWSPDSVVFGSLRQLVIRIAAKGLAKQLLKHILVVFALERGIGLTSSPNPFLSRRSCQFATIFRKSALRSSRTFCSAARTCAYF